MSDISEALSRLLNRVIEGQPIDWAAESSGFTDAGDRERLKALIELDTVARRLGAVDIVPAASPPEPVAGWEPLRVRRLIRSDQAERYYQAWDPKIRRKVALSVFPLRGYDSDARARMIETLLAYSMMRSPHIAIVYSAQIQQDHLGVSLEWVSGRSLQEILLRDGPFSVNEACLFGVSICRALSVMHADGLLCGPLTPGRVVRENGGRIVITELPISVLAEFAVQSGPRTRPPGILPPEERKYGGEGVQRDIGALGLLLDEAVYGGIPAADRIEYLGAQGTDAQGSSVADAPLTTSGAFRAVIERALHRTPNPAFESAGEMERALLAIIQGRASGHDDR